LDFGGTQTEGYLLYQLSSPAFISDDRILFSARRMDIPSEMFWHPTFDTSRNTAIFMSNFDGTKLERVRQKALQSEFHKNKMNAKKCVEASFCRQYILA
jgi:hypothetical protein